MSYLKEIAILSKRIIVELRYSAGFDYSVFPEMNLSDYEKYHGSEAVSPCPLRIKLISDWIQPNSTILDVGCGEGLIAEELAKTKMVQVYGIDVSVKAISKFISKGFHGEVQDLNSDGLDLGSKYDYVLLVEVLEHLRCPQKVLIQACEHAEKGVIITLPNSGYLRWRLQMLRGYFPRQSFTHIHFWSINDFEIFLKALGLRAMDFKSDLAGRIGRTFQNLLAYQQCWLVTPKIK
jgi:methionine biosynthesis protein MetW